jgi:hypothetical protein
LAGSERSHRVEVGAQAGGHPQAARSPNRLLPDNNPFPHDYDHHAYDEGDDEKDLRLADDSHRSVRQQERLHMRGRADMSRSRRNRDRSPTIRKLKALGSAEQRLTDVGFTESRTGWEAMLLRNGDHESAIRAQGSGDSVGGFGTG